MSTTMADLGINRVRASRDNDGYAYARDEIIAAATLYASLGTYTATSDELGIPATTLRYWADNNDAWAQQVALVRSHKSDELINKLGIIIGKALDKTEGGIDNLNVSELKAGDVKALMITAATAQDKQRLLMGLPSRITETQSNLTSMADQFAAIVAKRAEKVVSDQ